MATPPVETQTNTGAASDGAAAFLSVGLDGNLTLWNHGAESMFGYCAEEILGKPLSLVIPPRSKEGHAAGFAAATRNRQTGADGRVLFLEGLRKNGEEFPLEVSILLWEGGETPAFIAFLREVSEKKLSDQEQQRLETRLQQRQKLESLGVLAGGIAHDFNNILAAILGYAEITLGNMEDADPARPHLLEIAHAANRGKDLVLQILASSRQVEQQRRPVLIEVVVEEALKLLRASLPTTIEIRQHIEPDCGYVLADPSHIHQVIMNLCTNAYQAMGNARGFIEIRLGVTQVDPGLMHKLHDSPGGLYIQLMVTDTGTGMDQATLDHIFDPFFTTKPAGEGTGMGLSIVNGIVRSLGGALTVKSAPGAGSTFTALLPRHREAGAPETSGEKSMPPGCERILFVDDEEPLARMGELVLGRLGYHVTAKTSSLDALDEFRAQPALFDLVITDQSMPNMTGIEFTRELHQIRSDIPVILATGFSESMTAELARDAGIDEFVLKPIGVRDLSVLVRRVLDAK